MWERPFNDVSYNTHYGDYMITTNLKKLSIGFLVAILVAITAFPTGNSLPTGITDEDTTNKLIAADGCYCHNTNPIATSSVIVNLTLPANFTSGETYTIILNISGGPNDLAEGDNRGGFFITASDGELSPVANDTRVQKPYGLTHLTHTAEGNDYREWSFEWTAPDKQDISVEFVAYGNSVNGADGSNEDYWNKQSITLYGVDAVVEVKTHEDLSGPQKLVYAFAIIAVTLSVVVIGNQMVTKDQAFEDVLKGYWKSIYPWLTTTDHKYVGILYIC
ncbi:MAG: choice-of-anchor V domain-containing protein, partial [Candidatus Poseidoniales archaeon]